MSLFEPRLPDHCEPQSDFLYHFSSTFHTCVPTNWAFISTLLGTCSIVAWLFAQLPQIYKNYQIKSTTGLSFFFLAEWLLGDLSNLLGSVFTSQALWQVIIAGYYVLVDCALVGQWIWYERLKHGRPLLSVWSSGKGSGDSDSSDPMSEIDGISIISDSDSTLSSSGASTPTPAKTIPESNTLSAFRTLKYGSSPASTKEFDSASSSPAHSHARNIKYLRAQGSSPMPSPSPKTVLMISLLLAVLSNAQPIDSTISTTAAKHINHTELAGRIVSYMSTLLYLGSRLPQLYKNFQRRSTAGLSPTLFIAAFFGNLFYSTSLLTNPCAWNDYAPHDPMSRGWVSWENGSKRREWVGFAIPFFLGAAGVLLMDAAVGVQFLCYGEGGQEEVVIVGEPAGRVESGRKKGKRRWRWRRVSGWMRGWIPTVSPLSSPKFRVRQSRGKRVNEGETDSLLPPLSQDGPRDLVYGGV